MNDIQIIDGVNVKDCKRRIGKNNFCRYYKRPCAENNYNCIWKKYLRKEQECKALREEKAYTDMACEQFEKQLKAKEQECEELKEKLEKIRISVITHNECRDKGIKYAEELLQIIKGKEKAISRNRNNDISKTKTIMRDIKARAEKGHTSYEYRAYINYAIAKTLYENGFKLLKNDRELFLEDFQNNATFYSVIISWGEGANQ